MYGSKYGITQIISDKIDNLSINYDADHNIEDIKQRFPVLLFTPDIDDTNTHYHISLTLKQTKVLYKWLSDFIQEKENGNKLKRSRSNKT